jgi:hypothetical protein
MRTQLTNVRANSIRPLLTATLGLAITFTLSCSSGDDPDDNGGGGNNGSGGGGNNQFNENSQIYNKDGSEYNGSGVIKIRLSYSYDNSGNYSETAVNAGSVTNGIVKLELPPTISDEYLCYPEENNCLYLFWWGLGDEWGLWGEVDEIEKENERCIVSPEDIKIFGTDNFRLYDNNEKGIGKLYGGVYHDDDGNEYFIEYLYFTKAAKITCDNKFKKFDINAKAGWNKVYIKDPDSDDCKDGPNGEEVCKAIVSTNNFFIFEVK